MTRDLERPLAFRAALRAVFDLALDGMIWTRRSLGMAVLVGLPVAFAAFYRIVLATRNTAGIAPLELYGSIVVFYWIGTALPLAALFYATSLVADEVEGRTLGYLLTRPISRSAILAGKFGAYLAAMLALALPAQVATFFLLATARNATLSAAVPDLFTDAGVLCLTLLCYGALFCLLGVLLKRPLVPGLLFVFIWEWVSKLPGYMPRLTFTAYLKSLVRHRPAEEGLAGLFGQVLPLGESLAVLLGATLALLCLAFWIFSNREYVMEQ